MTDPLRQAAEQAVSALADLFALVRGECPSLLNEDSGGSAHLDIKCTDAIASLRAALAAQAQEPDLRAALLQCARQAEALKRECGMDPESPQAIRNAQYQAISTTAHIALGTIRGPKAPAEPQPVQAAGEPMPELAVYELPPVPLSLLQYIATDGEIHPGLQDYFFACVETGARAARTRHRAATQGAAQEGDDQVTGTPKAGPG